MNLTKCPLSFFLNSDFYFIWIRIRMKMLCQPYRNSSSLAAGLPLIFFPHIKYFLFSRNIAFKGYSTVILASKTKIKFTYAAIRFLGFCKVVVCLPAILLNTAGPDRGPEGQFVEEGAGQQRLHWLGHHHSSTKVKLYSRIKASN